MAQNFQKPSIGRVVHYVHVDDLAKPKPRILPALIIKVYDDEELVDLKAFDVENDYGVKQVPFDEDGEQGTWNWPPRV